MGTDLRPTSLRHHHCSYFVHQRERDTFGVDTEKCSHIGRTHLGVTLRPPQNEAAQKQLQ